MNTNFGLRHGSGIAAIIKSGQIVNPSRAVMLSDTYYNGQYPYFFEPRVRSLTAGDGKGMWGGSSSQAFRHTGSANCAWADGHVSAERPGELGSAAWEQENNVGWLGTNDAPYCLTAEQFEERGLVPGQD